MESAMGALCRWLHKIQSQDFHGKVNAMPLPDQPLQSLPASESIAIFVCFTAILFVKKTVGGAIHNAKEAHPP